ncbi:MAG TPA: aldo/keto reductase [Dehalococcoidia bacterium]|nr:aldo/keto reductase [Dehalococcoidia bacterium]
MEYRNLGNSGLQVSLVGLGCNNFGGRVDAAGTKAVVDKCIDMGITLFDTADIYGPRGKSEEFLGPALKPHRRNIVIATKSAGPMGEGPYWSGTSRKYLMDAVDDCLRRLETDYIDLYQMHFPTNTPIEETLRALDDIVRSGKVRYIGSSNYAGWQVVEAAWVAKTEHLTPFISAQNQYNLLERGIEKELVPAAKKYSVGILPYFPLASGFLTGKYRKDAPQPEGARLSGSSPFAGRTLTDANYDKLEKLDEFAKARGHTMTELAFGWLASLSFISSVIAGATRPEQVEENAKAADWKLSTEEMDEIDEILGMTPPAGFGPPARNPR